MVTAKGSSPSSASSKRWKRADTVMAFPSSKRIQSAPYPPHSNAGASVWVRVSEKPANSVAFSSEDLQVSATAKRKLVTDEVPDEPSSEMDIDADSDGSGPKVVDVSHKFALRASSCGVKEKPQETDPHKLGQRQKQIDYGKNTLGYERYLELVPRSKRKKAHPETPDIKQVCSKRSWDGQVKKWRRRLHEFDPPASTDDVSPQMFSVGRKEEEREEGQLKETEEGQLEEREGEIITADPSPDHKSSSESGTSAIYRDWDEMEP